MTDPAYLLDSNICIYVLADSDSEAARRLRQCVPGSAVTSSIAYAEVALGVAPRGEREMRRLDRFFDIVPVLPFDYSAARIYAQLPFRRGTFDRLIAAHALALDLVLVTNNLADFRDVPALRIENWAEA